MHNDLQLYVRLLQDHGVAAWCCVPWFKTIGSGQGCCSAGALPKKVICHSMLWCVLVLGRLHAALPVVSLP